MNLVQHRRILVSGQCCFDVCDKIGHIRFAGFCQIGFVSTPFGTAFLAVVVFLALGAALWQANKNVATLASGFDLAYLLFCFSSYASRPGLHASGGWQVVLDALAFARCAHAVQNARRRICRMRCSNFSRLRPKKVANPQQATSKKTFTAT
jgi:hypothetical protein